jgi:hypothetical protein
VLPIINSETIDSREVVARYLLSSSDYSVNNARVKPRALEPSPSDQCTSVFRIDRLTENEIWDLGMRFVAEPRARRVHARADITVSNILNLNLSVRPNEPPVRHALIAGWSNEKHVRMAKAQELAAQASLKLNL